MRAADVIVPGATRMGQYAERLLVGVPAEMFARRAKGIDTNHACWALGHLSLYGPNVGELVGVRVSANPAGWAELFKDGTACVDDADGKVYPPMRAVVDRFRASHAEAIEAIRSASDEVFSRPNPNEARRDVMPTVGCVVAFYVLPHVAIHLGQVSAWRRCMGLGAA